MAHIYYANGEIKEVTPKNGTDFQLEELQEIVGGYIEVLNFRNDPEQRIMVLNEEGKLEGLLYNSNATAFAAEYCGIPTWDCIVGDVLICHTSEVQ